MNARTCLTLLALMTAPALAENPLRDPFVPLDTAPVTVPARLELIVTGIVQSGPEYAAIVRYGKSSSILQVGDSFQGARVLRITPAGLTLLMPGESQQVRLGETDLQLSFQYAYNYSLASP